jgi:hypothetical protein
MASDESSLSEGENPICDPMWSCILQDYSDDEDEPTGFARMIMFIEGKARRMRRNRRLREEEKAKSKAESWSGCLTMS